MLPLPSGHTSLPRNSPGAVTLVPTNFLFQKESRRTPTVGGHHSQRRSALPSPPYPALLDSPADSATIAPVTATAMSAHDCPFADSDTMTYSATTTPLSPPSPTLPYSNQSGPCPPRRPISFEAKEACYEPLPSLSQVLMPQIEPSPRKQQQRQPLPSFRQFVHQTHSPETPQSSRFSSSSSPSLTHDRRHSLPSFGQLVAQIHDQEERRLLPSLADLVAGTPAALPWRSDEEAPLFHDQEDDRWTQVSEETVPETPRAQRRQPHGVAMSRNYDHQEYRDQRQQQRRQYPNKVDSISMLAAAAAEIERDTDDYLGQTSAGLGERRNLPFTSIQQSPTISAISSSSSLSSTDVSAKKFQRQPPTHHRSSHSYSYSNGKNSTWLWRRPSDDRWVQRQQASPPRRDRSDDFEDYEMADVKQEEDEAMMTTRPRIDLPPKKRKGSLTTTTSQFFFGSSSGSNSRRSVKRSAESMTDDTRSEMQSEGDDHFYRQPQQQPPKAKKKRMSKPKDPNYVSPSGFRHGGERRVQEPDEVVEMAPDVGPVSMLRGSNLPKVSWKGTPLPVDGKPGAERLHPHEAYIASTLRLSPAQYLLCKKTLILASREFQSNHKVFRKTDAQKLCHVDVNKASKLWEVFTKIGWLAGNTDEDA